MRLRTTMALLLLACGSLAVAAVLPQAPTGYSWVSDEDGTVSVLRPDGWFVKRERKGDTEALFVSKEDIDKDGIFHTGFSMNLAQHVSKQRRGPPSQFGAALLAIIASKHPPALENKSEQMAPGISRLTLRIRDGAGPITTEYVVIADDPRDSLRLLIFEAPEDQWADAWKIGDTMLSHLILQ